MSKRLVLLRLALTLLRNVVVLVGITPVGWQIASASVVAHDYDDQGNLSATLDVVQDFAAKDEVDAAPTVQPAVRRADKLSVDPQQHPALRRLEDSVQARGPPQSRGGAGVGDDVYAGVREASRVLKEAGVPRRYRKQVLESFDVRTLEVVKAGDSTYGLRYLDGFPNGAAARGRYLFETFPASRQSLALPPRWNQMGGIMQWQLRPGSTHLRGRAAPQGPQYPGGQVQKYVLDPVGDLLEVGK